MSRVRGSATVTTSTQSSGTAPDFLPASQGMEQGSVYEWPPIHWLPGRLMLVRPRPDEGVAGPFTVPEPFPADGWDLDSSHVEGVVAFAKRRRCVVISCDEEIASYDLVRVVEYYGANKFIERYRVEVQDHRFLRFQALPVAPWDTKDNVLDFMAACQIPKVLLTASGRQVGRVGPDLVATILAQYARYVQSPVRILPSTGA